MRVVALRRASAKNKEVGLVSLKYGGGARSTEVGPNGQRSIATTHLHALTNACTVLFSTVFIHSTNEFVSKKV